MSNLSVRGLATLAFLKTRFDQGHDHLGLFEPFVQSVVATHPDDGFGATGIRDVLNSTHGLSLPVETVTTILGRLVRRGELRVHGGRYFKLKHVSSADDLEEKRRILESEQERLAQAFIAFALENGVTLSSAEDALALILAFINDHNVALLLEEPLSELDPAQRVLGRRQTKLVARFVSERCFADPELRPPLEHLLEGMILQNAILLKDIRSASEGFQELHVYLDTPVLMAAVGLVGTAAEVATKDSLHLLRQAGAVTYAFDRTVDEIRGILLGYESRLATPQGQLRLRPSELTHHLISSRATPSDVRTFVGLLEKRLTDIGIVVRPIPPRDRRYTLDEAALAESLKGPTGEVDEPRVRHDVDCIAGILTIRGARYSTTIERAKAVFSTTSGSVVRTVLPWFREQGVRGCFPIIHHHALTNIAWLKKPAAAKSLKLNELVALCGAALRPSARTWDRFLSNLRKLRDDGAISDEEAVAVLASQFTEPLLASLDDDTEPEADSIGDVIERVIEQYRCEASSEASVVVAQISAERDVAQVAAGAALAQRDRIYARVELKARAVGRAVGMAVKWVLNPLVALGILSSLPWLMLDLPGVLDIFAKAAVAVLALLTFLGLQSGLNVLGASRYAQLITEKAVRSVLVGADSDTSAKSST